MTKSEDRRARTLSISLTRELSEAVSERVQSGLYTSASELIREALRLLLRSEERRAVDDMPSLASARLSTAAGLMQAGRSMQAEKLRQANPELSEEEVQERIRDLESELETGPGLRRSPERLKKLTLNEPD